MITQPATINDVKKTALYDWHLKQGARMIPFAGYEMPIQYKTGILNEHKHVRALAGLFDVSHMGLIEVRKIDHHEKALSDLMGIRFEKLLDKQLRYGLLLNDHGGIEDDLIIINQQDRWLIVVNAARKEHDLVYLKRFLDAKPILDVALIALQGPQSRLVLDNIIPGIQYLTFMQSMRITYKGYDIDVSCSGYTGEDGFELMLPNEIVHDFVEVICSFGDVAPIGLGARDSLRLEAGLCLYGHDMNDQITPVDASLVWAISPHYRTSGEGIAGTIIKRQLEGGVSKKRVGLQSKGQFIAREGAKIFDALGSEIGSVTSGLPSPTLGFPIAMGYVNLKHASVDNQVFIEIRGNRYPFEVCEMPFVPHKYKKGN